MNETKNLLTRIFDKVKTLPAKDREVFYTAFEDQLKKLSEEKEKKADRSYNEALLKLTESKIEKAIKPEEKAWKKASDYLESPYMSHILPAGVTASILMGVLHAVSVPEPSLFGTFSFGGFFGAAIVSLPTLILVAKIAAAMHHSSKVVRLQKSKTEIQDNLDLYKNLKFNFSPTQDSEKTLCEVVKNHIYRYYNECHDFYYNRIEWMNLKFCSAENFLKSYNFDSDIVSGEKFATVGGLKSFFEENPNTPITQVEMMLKNNKNTFRHLNELMGIFPNVITQIKECENDDLCESGKLIELEQAYQTHVKSKTNTYTPKEVVRELA